MKTHRYTLLAALLASPALIAPVSASSEPEPGSTGDLAGDLLKLEQESWNHFKFFFNTYEKMCASGEVDRDTINSLYYAALRVNQISGIIYRACHTPHDDKIRPFKDVIRERKFREGIELRDKATRGIVEHMKQNNYFNSETLEKCAKHLLSAIGTKYHTF